MNKVVSKGPIKLMKTPGNTSGPKFITPNEKIDSVSTAKLTGKNAVFINPNESK